MHKSSNEYDSVDFALSGVYVPVIAGLAVGIAFITIFSMLFALPLPHTFPDLSPSEKTLRNIEKVPEVALFLERYEDHNSTIYFGRSENGTVRFIYEASAGVDKDGNGYKETNHRLQLVVIYDESGGRPIDDTFEPERVKHMEAHCKEQTKVTPNIDEAFADIMPPAYNDNVRDFIQNSGCFSVLAPSFQEPTTDNQPVIVVIPEGSSLVNSERNNFEPETITVVIGVNNTVTWINEDNVGVGIRAGDMTDPDFFSATEDSGLLGPSETFSFTFTKPGNFTYYSAPGPHRQGTIVVLPTDDAIPTSVGLSQYEAIQIVENDFESRQSDYDRINGIIVNNTSGYVRIEEFWFKNLELPLVYVHPNGTLVRINSGGQEHMGECNSGLFAYCGYLEPYNFDYRGRLVYGVEVLLWNQDNPPEAESGRGFPFLYIVDTRTGEIVDSTFLREEWYRETQT